MPVQTTNSIQTSIPGLEFAAATLTWTIAPNVVVSSSGDYGVYSSYISSTLINHGIANSDSSHGVYVPADYAHVINADGAQISAQDDAVNIVGYQARVQNLGLITGSGNGVRIVGEASEVDNAGYLYGYSNAVWITASVGGASVTNSGEMNGYYGGLTLSVETTATIHNQGLIAAPDAVSLWFGSLRLSNDGVIAGRVLSAGGADEVLNAGRIFGAVELADGADALVNGGRIFGAVLLGLGADVYDGRGGSHEGFYVDGGDGDDLLRGGGAEDNLRGGLDVDTLNGKGGDDVLAGGRHGDRLTGGGGADEFAYLSLLDSAVDPVRRDTITDFHRGEGDVIDLSALDAVGGPGNQAFDFIGTAAFSNVAGQLRYGVSGGNALVQADVNGDGAADFTLLLSDVSGLNAGDFVL